MYNVGSWFDVRQNVQGDQKRTYKGCVIFNPKNIVKLFSLSLTLSLSLFLFLFLSLSLSLRERESWHYNHFPHHTIHPATRNFLRTLEVTYTQVWYIIGIVSSSPTDFHSEKIGLIRVTYDPPVSVRVNKYSKWLKLKCDMSLESSAQAQLISTQKI